MKTTRLRAGLLLALSVAAGCGEQPLEERVEQAAAAPVSEGRALFEAHCLACHGAGPEHPGTMRLSERLGPEQAPLLNRPELPPEYIKLVAREGFKLMPPFRPSELDDRQLDVLAAYIAGERN